MELDGLEIGARGVIALRQMWRVEAASVRACQAERTLTGNEVLDIVTL